jgi:hypothetical protein
MPAKPLRCLLVAATVLASLPAGADEPPPSCELPASDADPLRNRAAILAEYQRLPRTCLQALFAACTQASNRHLLDFGSAAACSFGYEALLSQQFGGNFRALMAWWSSQRRDATE